MTHYHTAAMAQRAILGGWTIELDDGFQRRVDGGDVMFWQPPRTVYATVYASGDAGAEEAIARMIEGRPGTPVQKFDRVQPGTAGHAYLLPEGEGRERYWGLNTWIATRDSVACVTFYFEQLDDLEWALAAWRSVRCEPPDRRYLN
jgi:hypothetical protein